MDGKEELPKQPETADHSVEYGPAVSAKLLKALSDGVIKIKEKEYKIPDEKKGKLRKNILRYVNEGMKFDMDKSGGLDEKEWAALDEALQGEVIRWLNAAQVHEMQEEKRKVESVNLDVLLKEKTKIETLIKAHESYERGEWRKINVELAQVLGLQDLSDDQSRAFGGKIQAIINEKLPDYDCGETGKIGPRTLAGLAKILEIKATPRFSKTVARKPKLSVSPSDAPVEEEASPKAPEPKTVTVDPEASTPEIQTLTQKTPRVELPSEKEARFAGRLKPSEAEQVLNQFSSEQKLAILKALTEGESIQPEQRHRILQINMIKTVFESMLRDASDSRTWGEWFQQALGEFETTTMARREGIRTMLKAIDMAESYIKKDPNISLEDALAKANAEAKCPDIKKVFRENTSIARVDGNGRGQIINVADMMQDGSGRLKEVNTEEEIQAQYLQIIELLRSRKDYATAQTLVENMLFAPQFAKKRKNVDSSEQQRIHDKSYEKINKMVTADVLAQYRQQGMTDPQIEEYKKQAIAVDEEHELNKVVAQQNNGYPFKDERLNGSKKQIMEAYRDMMGYGDWHNLSDATWDKIMEEVIINAPLILLSGGIASAARAGLTAGARAVIASGRIASLGIKAVGGAEKIVAAGKWGKTLVVAGKIGGAIAEGAVFSVAHSTLQGKNFFAQNWKDQLKEIAWSSLTLGAFHWSGGMAKKFNESFTKNITKVAEGSMAAVLQGFLIKAPIEAMTMLATGAAQHFTEHGNLNDFNWGEQILHACLAVGALKISGTVVSPVIQVGAKKFVGGLTKVGAAVGEKVSAMGERVQSGRRQANEQKRQERLEKQMALHEAEEARQKERAEKREAKKAEKAAREAVNKGPSRMDRLRVQYENAANVLKNLVKTINSRTPTKINLSKYVDQIGEYYNKLKAPVSNLGGRTWSALQTANQWAMDALTAVGDRALVIADGGAAIRQRAGELYKRFEVNREAAREAKRQKAEAEKARMEEEARVREEREAERKREEERAAEVTGPREWHEVQRSREVMAVGDLHGNYNGFKANLENLGVVDGGGNWSGGNRKVVFHGDILADRGTDGLRILGEIGKLREQARKQGGDIVVLAGNHEDFALSFLMGKKLAGGGDPLSNCEGGQQQGAGLKEFKRFGSSKLQGMEINNMEIWRQLGIERQTILQNMRRDPQGRALLESMCEMKLVERVDDSIFVHTAPTARMMEMIATHGIEAINGIYRRGLREALLDGRSPSAEFVGASDIFLTTGNRESFADPALAQKLKGQGINQIFYGHQKEQFAKQDVGNVMLVPVDYGAFKAGTRTGERSVAKIGRDGQVEVGAQKTQLREVEDRRAKEERAETVSPRPVINSGEEVYMLRSNGVVEKGWGVEKIGADGTYKIRNITDPTISKEVSRDDIWSIEEIESPRDPNSRLGSAAAEFERTKFAVLRQHPTLRPAEFNALFNGWKAIRQQNVGNCYLISALNAMRMSPHFEALVRTSIKPVKGGWEIRVPLGDPSGDVVMIELRDLKRQKNPNRGVMQPNGEIDNREYLDPVDAPLGFQILEAAFGKYTTGGRMGVLDRSRMEGGYGHQALLILLSGYDSTLGGGNGNFLKIRIDSSSIAGRRNAKDTHYVRRAKTFVEMHPSIQQDALKFLNEFNPGRDMATVNTLNSKTGAGDTARYEVQGIDQAGRAVTHELANDHAYSIVSVKRPDLTRNGQGCVDVVNPWNTNEVLSFTYDQFMSAFAQISGVQIDYSKLFSSNREAQRRAS